MTFFKGLLKNERYHYIAIICLLILTNILILKALFSLPMFIYLRSVVTTTILPFVISFVIVYIFRPVLLWIERKSYIPTWITTFLFMVFLLISLLIFIEFFIPLLFIQINNLIREFPHYKEQLFSQILSYEEERSNQYISLSQITKQFFMQVSSTRDTNLIRFIIRLLKQIMNIIWMIILIPIIVFMMVKDYDLMLSSILKLFPDNEQDTIYYLFKRIDKKLGLYIRGQLLVFTYMLLGSFALFSLIGLKHAFLFAVLFSITNFIPYLGPYLGGIPVSIYAYYQSPHILIFVLLSIFFLQQFDGDIGQPIIFGKQLKLHPLIIIICMAIGSVLFGIIGLIIAIPLFIIIKEVYITYKPRITSILQTNDPSL